MNNNMVLLTIADVFSAATKFHTPRTHTHLSGFHLGLSLPKVIPTVAMEILSNLYNWGEASKFGGGKASIQMKPSTCTDFYATPPNDYIIVYGGGGPPWSR